MRVLLVNQRYAPYLHGGAERSVQHLAEGLLARGCHVDVATIGPQQNKPESINGVIVHRMESANFWQANHVIPSALKPAWHLLDVYNPINAARFRSIVRETKPDIVHTNCLVGFSSHTWSECLKRGIPVVHTLRDYHLVCPRRSFTKSNKPCPSQCVECSSFSAVRKRISGSPQGVAGVSKHILDKHLGCGWFCDVAHRAVIHNIVPSTLRPTEPATSSVGRLRVGFLGRLTEQKGLNLIVEVAKRCKAEVEWHIAGKGEPEYEEYLKEQCKELPVFFLGHTDPQLLMDRVDVLLISSLWPEPFARVGFEAFAAGVPVIGTNIGGTPELIQEGITGYLVGEPYEENLVKCLASHSRAHFQTMRPACLEAAKNYSPEAICTKVLDLYHSAMGHS